MATLRLAIRDDVLIVEKRGIFFWWRWYYFRSEEDDIVRMKNLIISARLSLRDSQRSLPKREKVLKARKEKLQEYMQNSGKTNGRLWREHWPRKGKRIRLLEDLKSQKRDRDKPAPQKPAVLYEAVVPTRK